MDPKKEIKFVTYNVWSREDVVLYKRMQAISDLVYKHSPDVIFFQEILPYILKIFQSSIWWKHYHSSPISQEQQKEKNFCMMLSKIPLENYACWKFATTASGKSYLEAGINPSPGSATMKPICIATTQLECPCPPEPMHCMERYTQAEHAIAALSSAENVVFDGDMSWDDDRDLPFPLPDGWADASPHDSWTYDGLWNEKLGEFGGAYRASHKSLQRRSNRFVCKMNDYKRSSIITIGDQEVGFKMYGYEYNYKRKYPNCDYDKLVLMPSCHRGLVLTLVPNEDA